MLWSTLSVHKSNLILYSLRLSFFLLLFTLSSLYFHFNIKFYNISYLPPLHYFLYFFTFFKYIFFRITLFYYFLLLLLFYLSLYVYSLKSYLVKSLGLESIAHRACRKSKSYMLDTYISRRIQGAEKRKWEQESVELTKKNNRAIDIRIQGHGFFISIPIKIRTNKMTSNR